MTTQEIAARFDELAQNEQWFEIQDELFADDVRSVEPPGSPYFEDAEGKDAVRRKGEEFMNTVEAVHRSHTTQPVVAGDHFAVGRRLDITIKGSGRVQLDEIMLYKVEDEKIVLEQFFY